MRSPYLFYNELLGVCIIDTPNLTADLFFVKLQQINGLSTCSLTYDFESFLSSFDQPIADMSLRIRPFRLMLEDFK